MKNFRVSQNSIYVCLLTAFLTILFFNSNQCLAANVPLQNVTVNVVQVSGGYNVNFSVNDPTRGTISGSSGTVDLSSWYYADGVVSWVYWIRNPNQSLSKVVGFSVYNPTTGIWNNKTTIGIDTDVISPNALVDGGVVSWWGSGNILRFAIFDPELNNWVIDSSPNPNASYIDATGTIAWRTSGNQVGAAVYDASRKSFRKAFSPTLTVPISFGSSNGTVTYQGGNGVSGSLGYDPPSGFWGSGTTKPLAYFTPHKTSGNVPLTVLFWDMSIGTNSWNWSFGDGGNSSTPNPVYTYNSAAGSPYTVTLTASGPGGSSSHSRTITPTTPHSISGSVANVNGFKVGGATVTLTGTLSRTTQTDSNGNYSFANLTANGNYTVTISKNGYTFTPSNYSFTNLTGGQTGNFTGKLNDKPSDFDGDGKTDASVFIPSTNYWWILNSSNSSVTATYFGLSTDKIVPRDFDGDGKTDIAVWRPSAGAWYYLQSSNGAFVAVNFGTNGDIPVANDYDGDDKADPAVFRPSDGTWYILKSSNSQLLAFQFGLGSDIPVPGDYDGDEKADFAVYRPSDLAWYVLKSSDSSFMGQQFGANNDKLVQGDYDGDGKTDYATFRPSDNTWRIKKSSDGTVTSLAWGSTGDKLTPGDYDGDGKTDIAIFRPSAGAWYINKSSDQSFLAINFGSSGDYPTPSSYIPE